MMKLKTYLKPNTFYTRLLLKLVLVFKNKFVNDKNIKFTLKIFTKDQQLYQLMYPSEANFIIKY